MAEMKMHMVMLRELNNDVKRIVANAKEQEATWHQIVTEVNNEREASTVKLEGIKKSFSLKEYIKKYFKTKSKSGITSEEARAQAERYTEYATTVENIADAEQRLEDAKYSLDKAEGDVKFASEMEETTERLITMIGVLDLQ